MESVKESILEFLFMAQDEAATDQNTEYTHPRKWWEVLGGHEFPLLRPIALRVFNMASSDHLAPTTSSIPYSGIVRF